MKRLYIFAAILVLCGLLSCHGQQDNGKTYNLTYRVGGIPGISDFRTLTEHEKRNTSIKDWSDNRSRLFMQTYVNGKIRDDDTIFNSGAPVACNCTLYKDTLFITTWFGFFGGAEFVTKVFQNNFVSEYGEWYRHDTKPFKHDMNDTAFYSDIMAKDKYQYLIFDEKPDFKVGQQLTGYLTFTSNNYYERSNDTQPPDTTFVTGRIYFACKTKLRE